MNQMILFSFLTFASRTLFMYIFVLIPRLYHIQVKLFKNRPSKICRMQPLKKFTWSIFQHFDPYGLKLELESLVTIDYIFKKW